MGQTLISQCSQIVYSYKINQVEKNLTIINATLQAIQNTKFRKLLTQNDNRLINSLLMVLHDIDRS